jgi:hypothetical protein
MPEGDNRNMISVMRPFSTMGHQLAGENPAPRGGSRGSR